MNDIQPHPPIQKAVLIGGFLPRPARSAAAASALYEALKLEFPGVQFEAVAVSDTPRRYEYPAYVQLEIDQSDRTSYGNAAESLNRAGSDLLLLQHDFDLFDGPCGSCLISFLRALQAPVIATLHHVPENPRLLTQQELSDLAGRVSALVVFDEIQAAVLLDMIGVPLRKIAVLSRPGNSSTGEAWRVLARRYMRLAQMENEPPDRLRNGLSFPGLNPL